MLRRYTLLRSQANRVYELLRQGGLEPAEFSWGKEEIGGNLVVSRLNYRDGTYYFQFSSHEVNAWCTACPGQFRSLDYEYPKSWEEQEGVFNKWVQHLKREIAASDPWGELAKYKVVFGPELDGETVNESISACEAEQIIQGLARLANEIERQLMLSEDKMAMVCAKFNYLADAARWQKSRDWLYTAIGLFVTVAVTLHLPETTAAALWQLFQNELSQFIHVVPREALAMPKSRLVVVDERAGQSSIHQEASYTSSPVAPSFIPGSLRC